jgi:hypothetical protein
VKQLYMCSYKETTISIYEIFLSKTCSLVPNLFTFDDPK